MAKREIVEVPVVSEAIRRLGAPTSALVRSGNFITTCGMPPVDIETGDIVKGDIAAQTRASLEALRVTLAAAGATFEDVIKTTIYVTDGTMMATVNGIYREYFAGGFPARTSATIKPWSLPFDIEIECLAVI
ncbi:RidA family protein [Agrobacterium tumefaciens]|uniref:RidA family protein n=1 Tax=Agrobacterium tumefaciens TaxID=358 RepID=UPI00045A9CBF|nr:Rid family hydrolase [Agrobacterium tumefaciens]CDN95639.1 Translation initiation inhibitor protein [Agrobacterium tumefaciens]